VAGGAPEIVISAALAEKQVMNNSAVITDATAYFKLGIGWFPFKINLPLHFARTHLAKRAAI
jgi:hypothetical protein